MKEKERMLDELQDREYSCRHTLAVEIAFTASKEEFREMDLRKPGQVIGWAINRACQRILLAVLHGLGSVKRMVYWIIGQDPQTFN